METYKRFNRNGGTTEHPLRVGDSSRIRYGKTAKDHANGYAGRAAARKAARAHWQRDADKYNPSPFPA